MRRGLLGQMIAVVRKDLLVEWRAPSRFSGVLFFAMAVLVMMSFATGSDTSILTQIGGGTLWIGILLASTRSLDQSFAAELEQGALEGLVLWPVDPIAMYYGKAVANTLVLWAVALVLFPMCIAMYGVPVRGNIFMLVALFGLGCASLAAPGTLYAAITSQARGASVLLPLLLFPLVVPALMAAAQGTTLVLEGDAMGSSPRWLLLLGVFNAVHWSISGLLFARVVEDS